MNCRLNGIGQLNLLYTRFVSKFDSTWNEGTLQQLYDYPALFQAKAYILNEPYDELVKYIDVPAFYRGDLFYIQNIVAALSVADKSTSAGDSNCDCQQK